MKMTIGERIKKLREKAGLTQAALGKLINTDRPYGQPYVYAIESGKRSVKNDVLHRLSIILDTSVEYLLKGDGAEEDEADPVSIFTNCYSFQQRLSALIDDRKTDITNLAIATGIEPIVLASYFNNNSTALNISINVILANILVIATILGVDPCVLAFGERK